MDDNWLNLPLNNKIINNPKEEVDFHDLKENYSAPKIYNENRYNKRKNFSPKIIFSFLLLIALGTLTYGFYSLSNNVYQSNLSAQSQTNTQAEADSLVEQLAIQKSLDTDKDGLNDYEEVNVYETSPYLADTDSDGYSDKTEIERGHDPLCPKEDNCRVDWSGKKTTASAAEDSQKENSSGNFLEEPPINPEANLNTELETPENDKANLSAEDLQALNSLTASEVRELLKTQGQITDEELSQIDDETLMQIYKEALASEQQ